jgi:hypothetical protein
MKNQDYEFIIVESFRPIITVGLRGEIHIRPIENQEPFLFTMMVECSKDLVNDYPLGTKFRIKGKITQREGGTKFIYSHYKWPYEVLNS